MAKTYYDILDIPPDATQDQIQQAYRIAVKFFHPDRQGDEKMRQVANNKLKTVNEAYSVLNDVQAREQYDKKIGVTYKHNTDETNQEGTGNYKRDATKDNEPKDHLIFKLPGDVLIEFVRTPSGGFLMGSDNKDNEQPCHRVYLPEFYIGKYPVTNAQYLSFVVSTKRVWVSLKKIHLIEKQGNHPAIYISWYDAQDFCTWMSEGISRRFHLPTEAEWEKAARGEYGKEYPWGDEFNKTKCNTSESGIGSTTPVRQFSPQGDSPYGVADMAGNVWEWCQSKYEAYPIKSDDGREDLKGDAARVLRGGSFLTYQWYARSAYRYNIRPEARYNYIGFRVVVSPSSRT